VNCPVCAAPLLFGAPGCACPPFADRQPGYWEALRIWWQVYWPSWLVAGAVVALNALIVWFERLGPTPDPRGLAALLPGMPQQLAAWLVGGAALLYLFLPRLFFASDTASLVLVRTGAPATAYHLTPLERRQLFFFLWWRQTAAGLLFLALDALIGGAATVRVPVNTAADLFLVGPFLVKMLAGRRFPGFRVQTRTDLNAL
jgi:hypothetical protein